MSVGVHPQVRIAVRPYGSVVPLGFLAFGIGMFMYAAQDVEWVKPAEGHTVGLMLAAFVAPLEGLAAILAFLGLLTMQAAPGRLSAADGYFLIAFTIVVLLLALVGWLGQPLIAALLTVSAARGASAAVYQLGGGRGWNQAAGWIALGVFCVAMYGGLAFLLEDARGRAVLPLGRRGSSREAIEGDLDVQLAGLAGEPGVRKHL